LKSLATDLEKRTLYVEAEKVWGEYAAVAELKPEETAELLYRRGKCLKEGGKYAEAARRLSEVEAYPVSRDEKRKARQLLLECLSALGKQDARDSVSRLFAIGEEEKGTAVAKIDNEVITKESLREELKSSFTEMLRAQGAPLTPQELDKKAEELADAELKTPEGLRQVIQSAASRRVLYLEGLERNYDSDPALQESVARVRRELIANRVIESEAENALKTLGPTELKNHYEANKSRFVEKAGSEFSLARFPGAAEAESALEKLKDPAKAGDVRWIRAKEAAVEGQPVPEVGPSPEACAHILALPEGGVSGKPIEAAGAFYIFRVEKKRSERQLSAEEAEAQVRADLAKVKRKEAFDSLRESLSKKYRVEILEEKPATGAAPPATPTPAPAPSKQP